MNRPLVAAKHLIGEHLGHYLILEKIGAGGMGEVYRARDEHLDREVAIKVLPEGTWANEESRRNFRREALILSSLNHPNIATVHDFDSDRGTDFLVTEYIPGTSLHEHLAEGALTEEEISRLATQLVEGMMAAHGQGIVHRDLKPGNLRVSPSGRLKILDFGLARSLPIVHPTDSTHSTGDFVPLAGTLAYMSPEQLRGKPTDVRSDLYSIGVILYEMCTGRRPFEAVLSPTLVDTILHDSPPPPGHLRPELSAILEQVILKCLEKEPGHRYQSSQELLTDLRRARRACTEEKSVAVLYFDNLSGQKEDEYFRDGITEDITTELSKIRDLRVFSRSAV